MKKNTCFFYALMVICLFQACYVTPKPVFKAIPETNESVWLYGKEFLNLQTQSYDIAIAFEGPSSTELVFDIEITNRSQIPVLVNPAKFYYDAVDSNNPSILNGQRIYATNPEVELIQIAREKSQANAAFATRKGNEALVSIFDLVADIATIKDEKTFDEIEDDMEQDDIREQTSTLKDMQHENKINNLENEIDVIKNETLRKTTVGYNYAVRGQVYFKIGKNAQLVKLRLPIGKEEVEIPYKLQKYTHKNMR